MGVEFRVYRTRGKKRKKRGTHMLDPNCLLVYRKKRASEYRVTAAVKISEDSDLRRCGLRTWGWTGQQKKSSSLA